MKWRKGHKTDTEEHNYRQITQDFTHHSLLSCQELFQFGYNMHIISFQGDTKTHRIYIPILRDKRKLDTKACVICNCPSTLKKRGWHLPKEHVMNPQCICRKYKNLPLDVMLGSTLREPSTGLRWSYCYVSPDHRNKAKTAIKGVTQIFWFARAYKNYVYTIL